MSEGRSKYGNKKTEVDGFVFDSRREANRYSELKLLEKAGEIKDLELQPVFQCLVNLKLVCKYVADFRYYDIKNSYLVTEDVKGFKTKEYIIKRKLVEALFNITITEVA